MVNFASFCSVRPSPMETLDSNCIKTLLLMIWLPLNSLSLRYFFITPVITPRKDLRIVPSQKTQILLKLCTFSVGKLWSPRYTVVFSPNSMFARLTKV